MEIQKSWFARYRFAIIGLVVAILAVVMMVSCSEDQADPGDSAEAVNLSGEASEIAEERGLTPDDVLAALKTTSTSAFNR